MAKAKGPKLVAMQGGKNDLGVVVTAELANYAAEVRETVDREARDAMKRLVSLTVDRAPYNERSRRGWHYKDKIASKRVENRGNVSYIWYVEEPDARLTHLLSFGHKKRGEKTDKTKKNDYLTKSVKEVAAEYEKAVKEALENGKQSD